MTHLLFIFAFCFYRELLQLIINQPYLCNHKLLGLEKGLTSTNFIYCVREQYCTLFHIKALWTALGLCCHHFIYKRVWGDFKTQKPFNSNLKAIANFCFNNLPRVLKLLRSVFDHRLTKSELKILGLCFSSSRIFPPINVL